MSTLAQMKERIADELARDDLAPQIAYAISDAISAYQEERFYFNETRSNTFTTIAGKEFYGASDAAWIGRLLKIDYVMLRIGNQPYRLTSGDPAEMETSSANATSLGQPCEYCFYDQSFRLYPTPDTSYEVRVGGSFIVPAPATDDESGNRWMTDAEMLIRARAKYEIAMHVLKDLELAQTMTAAVQEQLVSLKSKTAMMTQAEKGRVKAMAF